MKELQDQLEAEQYFSVSLWPNDACLLLCFYCMLNRPCFKSRGFFEEQNSVKRYSALESYYAVWNLIQEKVQIFFLQTLFLNVLLKMDKSCIHLLVNLSFLVFYKSLVSF